MGLNAQQGEIMTISPYMFSLGNTISPHMHSLGMTISPNIHSLGNTISPHMHSLRQVERDQNLPKIPAGSIFSCNGGGGRDGKKPRRRRKLPSIRRGGQKRLLDGRHC